MWMITSQLLLQWCCNDKSSSFVHVIKCYRLTVVVAGRQVRFLTFSNFCQLDSQIISLVVPVGFFSHLSSVLTGLQFSQYVLVFSLWLWITATLRLSNRCQYVVFWCRGLVYDPGQPATSLSETDFSEWNRQERSPPSVMLSQANVASRSGGWVS